MLLTYLVRESWKKLLPEIGSTRLTTYVFFFSFLFFDENLFIVLQHIVFSVTAIIANTIPNVPYQVGRQIHLEKQLRDCKNPIYPTNEKSKKEMDAKFLYEIRNANEDDAHKLGEVVNRNSWIRRVSRRISSNSLKFSSSRSHSGSFEVSGS